MKLNRIIIHELQKEEMKKNVTLVLSGNVTNVNKKSLNLIIELDKKYQKTYSYAKFDFSDDQVFPHEFQNYLNNVNDDSFKEFSLLTIKELKKQISNIPQIKGGFFVYSDYTKDDNNYISVFLARNTNGSLFKKNKQSDAFQIDDAVHVDMENLVMACRINVNRYPDDGKYLGFVKKGIPDIRDYFINWLSASELESSKILTDSFYDLVNKLELPIDEETNEKITLDDFREKTYNWIKSQPNQEVHLANFSNHFYGDDHYVVDFANSNNIVIDTHFKADPGSLKRFVRINVSADGIQLRFTRGELNEKVDFLGNDPNVVLINSKKFADALRIEISGLNDAEQ